MLARFDIEIFGRYGEDERAEAKYLVNGFKESLWTNDIDEAMKFLKDSIKEFETEIKLK